MSKKTPPGHSQPPSGKKIMEEETNEKNIESELEKMDYPSDEDIMNPASGAIKVPHAQQRHENPGDTLDVPGSELDDDMEDIGEEDEENNYYSLGGDKKD
ncbi:hypothetical protein [Flavihumibacter petaseus]|uniref:Uncharacterized protein n=1 Tax=Flavihumibacter petaseus NBRC 106054 TaxID=1220578 RepID=A0A0E9MVS0_9BACT|nr:hypothetical protein [Flavihumibacter petaseus]GAO41588.1 hypothetical protein FPE01S_01_06020 [Flavihumibacter petaseus NBRC 106054]